MSEHDDEPTRYRDGREVPGPGGHRTNRPAYGRLSVDLGCFGGTSEPGMVLACLLSELAISPADVIFTYVRELADNTPVSMQVVYVDRPRYVPGVEAFRRRQAGEQALRWRAQQARNRSA